MSPEAMGQSIFYQDLKTVTASDPQSNAQQLNQLLALLSKTQLWSETQDG